MIEFYRRIVERAVASAEAGDDPIVILRELPLSVFGRLFVRPALECPSLVGYLPTMPAVDIQTEYNGRANMALLPSSVSFMESVCGAYTNHFRRRFPLGGKVLDYGFGWGRLIRMSYYLTGSLDIYGFDPQQKSIDVCHANRVHGNLMLCNEVPSSLTVAADFFDLIYSFSVFTHLSFNAANAVLRTLRRHVNSQGMLAITVRPVEFWEYFKSIGRIDELQHKLLLERHYKDGFAYIPLKAGWKAVDGDVHFGDTSMSLEFISATWPQWQVVSTNQTLEDPYQIHVFLVPAGS